MLKFDNNTSQRIYSNYLKRVKKELKKLPEERSKDIELEIISHINDGIENSKKQDETEKLLDVIEKLGEPENFLQTIVADELIISGTKTLNPFILLKAFTYNLGKSVKATLFYSFFGLMYLLILAFALMGVSKLFIPDQVGLFIDGGKLFAFGIVTNPQDGEVLGYWIIPLVLAIAFVLYFFITKLIRILKPGIKPVVP